MKTRCGAKGSFTVEISLIMTLLIPLLAALIYTGFYMHDRAFLEGAALETVSAASLYGGEKDVDAIVEKKKKEFLKGKLMGTRDVSGTVTLGREEASAVFSGTFRIPGIAAALLGKSSLPVRADASLEVKNPKKTVNKIHSFLKMTKGEK